MILLDTHVLIWHIEGEDRLGNAARNLIEQERNEGGVLVSAISAWEVAQLSLRSRISLSLDFEKWFGFVLDLPGYISVPVDAQIAMQAAALDWEHRDPADRFLAATAINASAPLLTSDREFLKFGAQGHVQTIFADR